LPQLRKKTKDEYLSVSVTVMCHGCKSHTDVQFVQDDADKVVQV